MVGLEVLRNRRTHRKHFPQHNIHGLVAESDWGPTTYPPMGRHYQTPTGAVYPSVTTFIKQFEDPHSLDEWRAKVGEEEAQRIGQEARHRGTLIHDKMDHYILGSDEWEAKPVEKWGGMFNQLRRRVDDGLNAYCYTEHALWSDELGIAGRVDLCGIWRSDLAIIDFKNKSRFVQRERIESYFVQCAIYAMMHKERYGMLPRKLVILAAVESAGAYKCQEFVEDTEDYVPRILEMVKMYRQHGGNMPPEAMEFLKYKAPPARPQTPKKPLLQVPTTPPAKAGGLRAFFK